MADLLACSKTVCPLCIRKGNLRDILLFLGFWKATTSDFSFYLREQEILD
jgi:hypothetical protein